MKISERLLGMKLNTKFTTVIILFAVAPIAILSGILFHNMEQNVIDEHVNYMAYTLERNEDQIMTKIDSINMSTQFFLSDEDIVQVLNNAAEGKNMTTREVLDFKYTNIESLERLVNNNPLLYCVRVYDTNSRVQEMMPILYRGNRMQKLDWSEETENGWCFDYSDKIFSSLIISQSDRLAALITPIYDYNNGKIGTIEAAMEMKTMFPSLYENIEGEWSCFVTEDGSMNFGDNEQADSKKLVRQVLENKTEGTEQETYYSKIGTKKLVISYMPVRELGGALVSINDISKDVNQVYLLRNMFVAVMILILTALTFVINFIVKRMLRQFYAILKTVRIVQKGNLDIRIEQCSHDEMGELGSQFNTMLDRIQKLMADNIDRELLAKNSQIRALQNQINAHFIYNVLESIKMMAEIDEEYVISDAITSLGKLLRYSMKWVSGNVKVCEELEYIRNYLTLINLRFDYEIILSVNLPEILLEQQIPKMSLQPIVENAILHGIEQMAEDTSIYIKGTIERNDCCIEITDAGRGMAEEELEELRLKIAGKIETAGGKGNGIGLKNVQDRIVMEFGNVYGLKVDSKLGCYTKVSVCLPLKSGEQRQRIESGGKNENSINR